MIATLLQDHLKRVHNINRHASLLKPKQISHISVGESNDDDLEVDDDDDDDK